MDRSPIRALALGLSSAMGVQSDPVHKQVGVVLAIQNIIGKKEERTIACQAAGFTFQPMTASDHIGSESGLSDRNFESVCGLGATF